MVIKPVPRSAFKREVEVVEALLSRPFVVAGYAFIVLQPILDVLLDLTEERRWSPGCDRHVYDGGATGVCNNWLSIVGLVGCVFLSGKSQNSGVRPWVQRLPWVLVVCADGTLEWGTGLWL